MAGNKKPKKKFNPKKAERLRNKGIDYVQMANCTLPRNALYTLNAPIDLSLHRLHAGKGNFTDWANVWYRTTIALKINEKFYEHNVETIQGLLVELDDIQARNIEGKENKHLEDWGFTDDEFATFMQLHHATDEMHKAIHAKEFLSIYKEVSPLSTAVIDAFMEKYPPTPEQAFNALSPQAKKELEYA